MLNRRNIVACAICAAVGLAVGQRDASAQGFTRKVLSKTEYPGDKFACVLVEVEIEPNAVVDWHTHPGVESSYIDTGSSTLFVKGQPNRTLNAGDGFQIPPEVPHSVKNGPAKTKVIANYVVEKDKPLASPAQAPA
jgi:quercetin dioxygenase-like cupin family protein